METKKLGYLLMSIAIILIVIITVIKFFSKDDHELKLTALDNQSMELIKKSGELKRNLNNSINDLNSSNITIRKLIQHQNWNTQKNRDSLIVKSGSLQQKLSQLNNITAELENITSGIVDLQKQILTLQEEKENDSNKSILELIISVVVILGCFYTINRKNAKKEDREWAIRIITLVIGFWIGISI